MPITLTIHGSGTVTLAAHGIGDAEAQVVKELTSALPGARVDIREIRRPTPGPARLVDEYEVGYLVVTQVEIPEYENTPEAARRAAFRKGRAALDGTRFARTVWEKAEPASSTR